MRSHAHSWSMILVRGKGELLGIVWSHAHRQLELGWAPPQPCELRVKEFLRKIRVLLAEKWRRMLGQQNTHRQNNSKEVRVLLRSGLWGSPDGHLCCVCEVGGLTCHRAAAPIELSTPAPNSPLSCPSELRGNESWQGELTANERNACHEMKEVPCGGGNTWRCRRQTCQPGKRVLRVHYLRKERPSKDSRRIS